MSLVIIFIILALILYICLSSLKLRFRYDDRAKDVKVSYTLAGVRADFNDMAAKIYLAGIRVKSIALADIVSLKAEKKPEKAKEVEKKKKKKRFTLPAINFDDALYYLKKGRHLLAKVRIRYLNIDISDGFADPYYTGQLFAAYSVLMGVCPRLASHISFKPDFSADSIKVRGKGLVSIKMFYILQVVFLILTSKLIDYLKSKPIKAKKGASYG